MANPLINDGHLMGFWPLQEPSGTPSFHNFSPHVAGKPSGITFDLKVHTCLSDASITSGDNDDVKTIWPGTSTDNFNVGTSGVPYTNTFVAQGNHTLNGSTIIGEHSKVLIVGEGGQITRQFFIPPRIAQSGFTTGFWVNPQSNGRFDRLSPRLHSKAHTLLTLSEDSNGWMIGVSGALAEAAQNSLTTGNPRGLAAFIVGLENTASPGVAIHLNTPIESGKFTHITFSYRITSAAATTDAAYTLYKDGRLTASGNRTGITNGSTLTLTNTSITPRCLCVGGSVEATTRTDRYSHATGWGHLVSGVYYFNRVLNEGEILAMHNAGGLQPFEGVGRRDATEVLLTDPTLIGYYPFLSPGFPDISKNHNALISDISEGDETNWISGTGPFNRASVDNFGSAAIGLAASSGVTNSLISSRSFTIGGRFSIEDDTHDFDQNMLFSMGKTGSALTSVPSEASMCFYVDTDATNVNYNARFFPLGSHNTEVKSLSGIEINPFSKVSTHVAIAYDDQTKGIALYTNGLLQQSGTLNFSLADQVINVASSGFPLIYLQGVNTGILGNSSPYITTNGEQAGTEFFVFGRPLQQPEILFLAHSGINVNQILRTVHDPRLMGYWKGTSNDPQALIVPDLARVWDENPANLVRSTNNPVWANIETSDVGGPWYGRDEFSRLFTVNDQQQILNSPLGITSGVWTIAGGSAGADYTIGTTPTQRKSNVAGFSQRFKPFIEQRSLQPTNTYGYVLSFEVTPSGNIRSLGPGDVVTQRFNAMLHHDGADGNASTPEVFYSYLTKIAHTVGQTPGSSGVSIVFEARDGAASTLFQIASGNLTFGLPSRVLFHSYFGTPYYFGDANGTPKVNTDLYINGVKQFSKVTASNTLKLWSDNTIYTSDTHLIQFGGCSADVTPDVHVINGETGLGEIRLRNMFIMKGLLSKDDIVYFATSGIIDSPTITGFTNEQNTTQVTIKNSNLQGYWRFSGASGELDLSTKSNNLIPLARIAADKGLFTNTADNPSTNLRYLPGPLLRSDLDIQASGIGFENNPFTGNVVPPFMASGVGFTRPDLGFAVGLWFVKRATVAGATAFDPLLSFGTTPSTASTPLTDIDLNRSWTILWDSNENLKMVISQSGTGSMYINPVTASAASSGTVICGAYTNQASTTIVSTIPNDYKNGGCLPGHIDCWNHALWSYNATNKTITCYLNGAQVDQKVVTSGINLPLDPTARIISFFVSQQSPWAWQNSSNSNDTDSLITDICYFSAPITQAQAKYIAYNGIDDINRTQVSGLIGGFIHGQDTLSGIIGGYSRGIDTMSGIIAGYLAGSTAFSGIIGGFTHGLAIVSGVIGGIMFGGQIPSGLIGGYIKSSAQISGVIGGLILGGLSGLAQFDSNFNVSAIASKNFDSLLEIRKQSFSDFDATLIVFQDEQPPDVQIIIPGNTVQGLVPPFNQYFIGAASGRQGKTIVNNRWTFGDFTSNETSTVSGQYFYPISHRYTNSGIMLARFTAIDSNGIQNSATRIINIASGIPTVEISLSGQPRSGSAELIVDFQNKIENLPNNVTIVNQLIDFDDGKTSIQTNPSHGYTAPGNVIPLFIVRDGRGFIWVDDLEAGANN